MPLRVEVKLNDTLMDTIHIGRAEPFRGPDETYDYFVTLDPEPHGEEWHDRGVIFRHKYSDGGLVCVRRAIERITGGPVMSEEDNRVATMRILKEVGTNEHFLRLETPDGDECYCGFTWHDGDVEDHIASMLAGALINAGLIRL